MTLKNNSPKLLIALLFVGSIAYSQADSVFSFYPLNEGNSWQYRSTHVTRLMGTEVSRTVGYYIVNISGDTTLSNGRRYYVVEASKNSSVHPRYQRIDSTTSQIIAFDTSAIGEEYVIDSLRTPTYSSFSGCRLSSLHRTFVQKIDSQNYFGTQLISRNYFTLFGAAEGSPQILYTLTQGLGLTTVIQASTGFDQYPGSSTNDTLVYAKINGRQYGTLVSVSQNRKEAVSNFGLYQNFPNSFNSATILSYSLPEALYVSLRVYDVLGRVVATLVDEWQNRGTHSARFYKDDLSSGIYFYNLRAGRFDETKRLILLK